MPSRPKKIISREDAAERGLTHYYTGLKCKKGHLGSRLVRDKICVKCLAEIRHSRMECAETETAGNANEISKAEKTKLLMEANSEFLRRLHHEKLWSIRCGI
jgi:hypothetical protein